MKKNNIRLVAMDMDGTLTQHKSRAESECRKVLEELSESYELLMVCAGSCERVSSQLEGFGVNICGYYGMQYGEVRNGCLKISRSEKARTDRGRAAECAERIRKEFGFSEYDGDPVEFHESGMITFPILGTKAPLAEKLAYDPDRAKRRACYKRVSEIFSGYNVFIGGTSSFDIAPKPYRKMYALERYMNENGIDRSSVIFFGDDYGEGGNDSDVYASDIRFVCIDDYRDFPKTARELLL